MNKINSYPLPLIMDSTVIFNFGILGRFDILERLYAKQILIPMDVKIEVSTDKIVGPLLESKIKDGICEEYSINYECDNDEISEYIKLKRKFGNGESACLSIAKNWGATIATDDMRAAKKHCERNNISLIGTLGILFQAYDKNIISEEEGQTIIDDMINIRGYISPVSKFSDIIGWFKEHKGKELF